MAFSSSSRTWKYSVFLSFHEPDVPKTFLSHLQKQLSYNGSSVFDDQEIEKSQTIAPALIQAIRESKISIVVLSKNYASSSWCLDELVEILKCREAIGQIVIPVFYGVDPSDVLKQTGEFGIAFNEVCEGKTEEERQRWSQALTDAGSIAGEYFLNWNNASDLIEKIARDVSEKLNTTMSGDFEDIVGLEAHLEKIQSLLHLDNEDETMIVGICGPAGIGKTTIARALYSRLSSSFQLTCFMENLRGNYNNGLDEYGYKLRLQEQLLSKILNQNGMRIYHLGAIKETLCDQKVLIILDDVEDLQQLETLANGTHWFGPGSRIIVTTEDKKLLLQHGINHIYNVGFPTEEEAQKIFCRSAFSQSSGPDGFEKLIKRVTKLCSNLPLGLRVMGSSLRGKKENEWKVILHRLENSLNQDIEEVLEVGFDCLQKNDQLLFLVIAFNYKGDDHTKAMLAGSNIDVRLGLKTLAYKSLIQISLEGKTVMHKLLQQVGREVVQRQYPWEHEIQIDSAELCNILENEYDCTSVHINTGALKRNLRYRFLKIFDFSKSSISQNFRSPKIYVSIFDTNVRILPVIYTIPKYVRTTIGALKGMNHFRFISTYKTRLDTIVREAGRRQKPKEQILIADEIRYALQNDSGSTSVTGQSLIQKPSSSNKSIGKSKSRCFTRMTFLVVNMLLEIASTVADQLSSIRKPFFARISLVMSFLSVALSIFDNLRFRYKWPIPWFDYPSLEYEQIFGSRTDTVLLFCAVGQLIASAINIYFIETGRVSPIKVSVWPLCFTIGMVVFKFMGKPTISNDNSCNKNVSIHIN